MCVALKHLHRFVPTDRRYLLVAQTGFHEATDGFMPQVMKSEVGAASGALNIEPHLVEVVRPTFSVLSWFAKKNQVSVDGADWVR